MATFWMRATQSVYRMFSFVFWLIVILIISHIGFEGGTLVLIASVPVHCLSFTFCRYLCPLHSIHFSLFIQKCNYHNDIMYFLFNE